jgi:hypothetical protein
VPLSASSPLALLPRCLHLLLSFDVLMRVQPLWRECSGIESGMLVTCEALQEVQHEGVRWRDASGRQQVYNVSVCWGNISTKLC